MKCICSFVLAATMMTALAQNAPHPQNTVKSQITAPFALTLKVDNGQVGELVLGCKQEATDGVDRKHDIAVPPFGMGTGVVGLKIPGNDLALYQDFRSLNLPQTWLLDCKVQGKQPIKISWKPATLPENAVFTLTYANGRTVNMKKIIRANVKQSQVLKITASAQAN